MNKMTQVQHFIQSLPEFDEDNMYPFYEKGVSNKSEMLEWLHSWLRKYTASHKVTYVDKNTTYYLVSGFRRAGYSHGIFSNGDCSHFLFLITEDPRNGYQQLGEGDAYDAVIDAVADFYVRSWNLPVYWK